MNYSDIIKLRTKYHISQSKLAEISGYSPAVISAWELGKNAPSDFDLQKVFTELDKAISNIKNDVYDIRKKRIQQPVKKEKRKLPAVIDSKEMYDTLLKDRDFPSDSPYVQMLSELYHGAKKSKKGKPKAIALFSGCGGLSLGFEAAGFDLAGHLDIEPSANAIYQANFPDSELLGTDICRVSEEQMKGWAAKFKGIDLIIGGPPCQGFSLAGKRDPNDNRNQLYKYYVYMVAVIKPKAFVMENVRLLTSMKTADGSLFIDEIIHAFHQAGYIVVREEVNACDYGVPQSRERIILVGIRKDIQTGPFLFPPKNYEDAAGEVCPGECRHLTFRDAVMDLPLLESGESSGDPLHWCIVHPDHVIRWLKDVPEGCSAHENKDPTLRPKSGYNTTYKRIVWDEPCSTISTTFSIISGCRNVHPQATRSFTIREAARVQSFPDEFAFIGKWGDIRKAIGNAVPPLLAKAIADAVFTQIFEGVYESNQLSD